MKKVSLFLFIFLVGVCARSFSQTTTPPDFFAGKWEITIIGTPNGNSTLTADLVRKDGKLTGQLINATDSTAKIPISTLDEKGDNLSMAFTAQGYDVTIDLTKVDDDNLKGTLMNSYEAKAKRLK